MTDHDDERLRRTLDLYNTPPPMPADSLWRAIEDAPHAIPIEHAGRTRRLLRMPLPWAAAAALMLFALGIATGAALTRTPPIAIDQQPQLTEDAAVTVQETKVVIWF